MQEGLLSRRLLYYTSSQMIWRCCEKEIFESGSAKAIAVTRLSADEDKFHLWLSPTLLKFKEFSGFWSTQRDNTSLSNPQAFVFWYQIIKEYSPRSFTNQGDRLVALSGVAKVYGEIIRCNEYVVGLWKPDLIRGLLWYNQRARLIPQHPTQDLLVAKQAFPSWGWASAGSAHIGFERIFDELEKSKLIARVDDVLVDLVDQSQPFGAVKRASITLNGPVRRLPRLYNKHWENADMPMSELERHISKIVEQESRSGVDPRYSSPPPGGHFAIVQMAEGHEELDLLVLESTGKVSGKTDEYRRTGLISLRSYGDGSWFFDTKGLVVQELRREHWGLESLTIV